MRKNPTTSCCLYWFFAVLLPCVPNWAHADEIVIGMTAAFSGPPASLGIELYHGSMAYIARVNNIGGVNGRKLVIKTLAIRYLRH